MKQFHAGRAQAISIVLTGCLGGIIPPAALAQTLVWMDADDRRMQTRDVSGGPIHTLIQFQTPPYSNGGLPLPQVQFDPVMAKLYFLWDSSFEQINVDGSERETIPTSSLGNFSVNGELGRLYWIEGFGDEVLRWSQLDGSGSGSHTYPTCCAMTALGVGNDLFFGAGGQTNKGIWRADSDGANEQFLHGSGQPFDLDYDPVEQKLYVSTIFGIVRMNTDGSGFQTIVNAIDFLEEQAPVAVDHRNRKVYWVDGWNPGMIRRANLDGTNVEDVITAVHVGNPNFYPRGLSIIFTPEPIPTMSQWGVLILAACVLVAGGRLIWTRRCAPAYS